MLCKHEYAAGCWRQHEMPLEPRLCGCHDRWCKPKVYRVAWQRERERWQAGTQTSGQRAQTVRAAHSTDSACSPEHRQCVPLRANYACNHDLEYREGTSIRSSHASSAATGPGSTPTTITWRRHRPGQLPCEGSTLLSTHMDPPSFCMAKCHS